MKNPIDTLRLNLEMQHQAGKNALGCFALTNLFAFNPLELPQPASGIGAMFSAAYSLAYFLQWSDYVTVTDRERDAIINDLMAASPLAD